MEKIVFVFNDCDGVSKDANADLVGAPKLMLCWGFEVVQLASAYGRYYEAEVFKSTLTGLKELSESKNKRKRERNFIIWGGYYLHDAFWIAVSARLDAAVTKVLAHYLWQVAGWNAQEYADSATHPLIPLFKYDYGQIIEYSIAFDGECTDAYGSGVKVRYQLLGEK